MLDSDLKYSKVLSILTSVHSKSTINRILVIWLVFLIGQFSHQSYAQAKADSLSITVESGFYFSHKENFLPHYIQFGNYGEVDATDDSFVGGQGFYQTELWRKINFSAGASFRNDVLSSAFGRLDYGKIFLEIGRVRNEIGGLKNGLSTGSLAMSRNAIPIPKLSAGTNDYFDVPLTHGYFKLKGHMAHGWLEESRYISNAQLHQKSLHGLVDLSEELGLKVSSGIIHFAQFGGTSPQGDKQPSSFSDFIRVFFGSGIPNPDGTTAGESNAVGNHLGLTEIMIEKTIGDHYLTLNYQKPFEDQGGIQYVSLTDYLIGIDWQLPIKDKGIKRVYVEMMQSKWQGGPGVPDATSEIQTIEDNMGYDFGQRDDYYNNWLYRSGWTYYGQVIGNPLFLTHERTLNFFDPYPNYGVSIANNRIWAIHGGLEGALLEWLDFKGLFTYSRNFGTYSGLYEGRFEWNGIVNNPDFQYPFRPEQSQFYTLLEFTTKDLGKSGNTNINVHFAYDFGDMYNLFGMNVKFSYRIK